MLARNKKKNERTQPAAVEPFTYIHRGTTITGTLEASGRVRVHGTIHGDVKVSGVLEVAEAGVIEGDRIEANEVKILGRVEANVHASGKIEIWKDGTLIGDVRARALDIEEGASFTGRSEMSAERSSAPGRLPGTAPGQRGLGAAEAGSLLDDADEGMPGADREAEGGKAVVGKAG